MQDHHHRIRQETGGLLKSLSQIRTWLARRNAMMPMLALGLCSGVVAGAITFGATTFPAHHKANEPTPERNRALPPSVEKRVSYLEVDLPLYGGDVGIMTIQGEVISAFMEGSDSGVVVVKALEKL